MSYNLHVMGMCLLAFALVVYLTNFKEVNKYFIWQWKTMIENGRDIIYAETHPKGPFEVHKSDKNFHYKQMIKISDRRFKSFHRKMLNPNKLVKE